MAEEEEHPTIADLPDVDAESLALALSLHRELNAPTRRTRREQPDDAPVARNRPSSATKKAKRAKKEEDSEAKSGDTGDGKGEGDVLVDDDKEEDSADAKYNTDGIDKKEKKTKRWEKQGHLEDQGEGPKLASKRKSKESKKAAKLEADGHTKQEGGGEEEAPKKKRRKKEPANDSNQLVQPDTTRAIKKQQPSPANIKPSRSARSNNITAEGRDDSKDLTNIKEDRIGGDNGDDGDMTALAGGGGDAPPPTNTNGAPVKPRGRPPGRSKASKKEGRGIPEHVRLAAEHRKLAAAAAASLAEGTIKCFLAGHESSVLLQRSALTDRETLAAAVCDAFGVVVVGGGGISSVFLNAKGEAVTLEDGEAWQAALAVFKAVAVYILQ